MTIEFVSTTWRAARSLLAVAGLWLLLANPATALTVHEVPDLKLQGFGQVYSSLYDANTGYLYVGGVFTHMNGEPLANLARFGPDGRVDADWAPSPNGTVRALALSESGELYIGGLFTRVGDQPLKNLAKVSTHGAGIPDPAWAPNPFGGVFTLAVDGAGFVYAGGEFSYIGGETRLRIAKLSADGVVDADWAPDADNYVNVLLLDGAGHLFVGGEFHTIAGQTRHSLAKLSTTGSGVADPDWNPNHMHDSYYARVNGLALDDAGNLFVGGRFSTIGGLARDNLAKLSATGTGAVDVLWAPNPTGGEIPSAIEIETVRYAPGGNLYVGGVFATIGGEARSSFARVSTSGSGDAEPEWEHIPRGRVRTVETDAAGNVYLGGSFRLLGGEVRSGLARLSASGGLDYSFLGAAGFVREDTGEVRAILRQDDGSLIVGGEFLALQGGEAYAFLMRVDSGGNIDPAWRPTPDSFVHALAADGAGRLYVGGRFRQIGGLELDYLARISLGGGGVDAGGRSCGRPVHRPIRRRVGRVSTRHAALV